MLVYYPSVRQILRGFVKTQTVYSTKLFSSACNNNTDMELGKTTLKKVVAYLDNFADLSLAEPWDNVGLLIEPTQPQTVSKILLTNDLTLPVLEEAVESKADLIISYHPPIFAPLKRVTQSTWKEIIVAKCLENKIAVYSPHTAWDATHGALGDTFASAFGNHIHKVEPIIPNADNNQLYDVMTIPENLAKIQEIAHIVCSFNCENSDKKIYRIIGHKNAVENLATFPDTMVTKFELVKKMSNTMVGMGRKVLLKAPGCTLAQCVEIIKSYTGLTHVRLSKGINHNAESVIREVALVPGSGASLLKNVKADLYVTGEMFHHDLLEASHRNVSVILTNHSDSERPFLKCFRDLFITKFSNIDVKISSRDKDPIETV